MSERMKRWAVPLAIYVVTAAVYVAFLGDRATSPSPDNHFVHLAESLLHGELGVLGNRAPGNNDWAFYEGRWYVSFPPFPAAVILPVVAVFHLDTLDRLFWALLAGVAPALIYVMLRTLRERGHSERSMRDELLLTTIFAFGSVYFFTAVQGAVWFAAHVVASSLLALFVIFSLDARRPVLAGTMIGLLFMTRPTTLLAAAFFGLEALRMARPEGASDHADAPSVWQQAFRWVRDVSWKPVVKNVALFSIPMVVVVGITMALNYARFDHPLEFGHQYLQIRWLDRIEKWGLFNYHYMSKNLAVMLAAMPWISGAAPFVMLSRHGIALWITTPHFVQTLFPKRVTATMVGLFAAAGLVAFYDSLYQNSGWIQFGYRFSLDYAPFLFALLAMNRRKFGPVFWALAAFAIAVNTFGAVTFDRMWQFYDGDASQNVLFQPD